MGIKVTELDNDKTILTYTCDKEDRHENSVPVLYALATNSHRPTYLGWVIREVRESATQKVFGGTAVCPECVQWDLRNDVVLHKKQEDNKNIVSGFSFQTFRNDSYAAKECVVRAVCNNTGLEVLAHGFSQLVAKEKAIIQLTARVKARMNGEDDQ
jgi:hypothetical protein